MTTTLQWRHNERDGVSNRQPRHCLLNRLFRCKSKKTSKVRVTGLCEGNSPVTGEFPPQRASNAENVSIWWRHHASPRDHPLVTTGITHTDKTVCDNKVHSVTLDIHIDYSIIKHTVTVTAHRISLNSQRDYPHPKQVPHYLYWLPTHIMGVTIIDHRIPLTSHRNYPHTYHSVVMKGQGIFVNIYMITHSYNGPWQSNPTEYPLRFTGIACTHIIVCHQKSRVTLNAFKKEKNSIFAFSAISQQWNGTDSWNYFPWMIGTYYNLA